MRHDFKGQFAECSLLITKDSCRVVGMVGGEPFERLYTDENKLRDAVGAAKLASVGLIPGISERKMTLTGLSAVLLVGGVSPRGVAA
jgi:hypothetical protein